MVLGEGFRGCLALKSRCKDTTVGLRSTNGYEKKYERCSVAVVAVQNRSMQVKRKFYIYISIYIYRYIDIKI